MKSIIICIPYFGKLPDYFQLFLNSCRYNETVDFLLLTDDRTKFIYPNNFKVVYSSFEDIQMRIKKIFDFQVSIDLAYKLCDYRPAYGEIFADYFSGYDFWGHCDVDLIFGDVRKFYTEDVLSKYDKVGHLGHLTLYRNNEEVNSLYRSNFYDPLTGLTTIPYKTAYTKNETIGFDEWKFGTEYIKVNEIFMNSNNPVFYKNTYADLTPYTRPFIESYLDPYTQKRTSKKIAYYIFKEGKVFAHSERGGVEERLYVHFLKRKMKVVGDQTIVSPVLIVPNKLICDRNSLSIGMLYKTKIMNVINPESKYRHFLVLKGKLNKTLRKLGLWK